MNRRSPVVGPARSLQLVKLSVRTYGTLEGTGVASSTDFGSARRVGLDFASARMHTRCT